MCTIIHHTCVLFSHQGRKNEIYEPPKKPSHITPQSQNCYVHLLVHSHTYMLCVICYVEYIQT